MLFLKRIRSLATCENREQPKVRPRSSYYLVSKDETIYCLIDIVNRYYKSSSNILLSTE